MKLLFIGDIIGRGGRAAAKKVLPEIKDQEKPDLLIANVENAASGFGLTEKVYNEISDELGIDALTSGNHIWDKKEMIDNIENYPRLLRPINYPEDVKGQGYYLTEINKKKVCVISLLGRVFVQDLDCPFKAMDKLLNEVKADIYIVDIHAEATSEKKALSFYLEKKISALLGTHTHVQTSDERILSDHTAYITDVGMVGGKDSIIGVQKDRVIKRFLTGVPYRFEVVRKGVMEFNSVLVEIDDKSGQALSIKRINKEVEI